MSKPFTRSNQFSYSAAFSPSAELLPVNPECKIYKDDISYFQKKCIYTADEEKIVYTIVLLSNFSSYSCEGNGSSVYLINCGLQCNDTTFINCVAKNRGGGAIYINNKVN